MNNLKKRVELCKLIIARDSMDSVAEASGLALANKIHDNHPLYDSIHAAIVSSYGRAFTEMQPLGRLHKKWSKFEDEGLRKTHKMLLYFRHKNVSHTDFIDGRVMLHPKGSQIVDNHFAQNFQYSVKIQKFSSSEFINIQKLAGNLAGRLISEIEKQLQELYGENASELVQEVDLISVKELNGLRKARIENSWLKRIRKYLENFF